MAPEPQAKEMERGLIVGLLSDPELVPRVSNIVSVKDFYIREHREIYAEILDTDLINLDSLVIEDKLDDDTKEYFKKLVQDSDSLLPGLSNILFYAETIRDKAKLRHGIDIGLEIAGICSREGVTAEEALEKLEQMFSTFIQTRVTDNSNKSTKDAFQEFISGLGVRVDDTSGIKTGYRSIDLILHKLEGLLILAARPGVGKTAWAINVAKNVAREHPVLFFSLEQPEEQIFERMLASESDVPFEDIRTGVFIANPHHVEAVEKASEYLTEMFDKRLHIDDTSAISASYIASVARQKHFEWGQIGLIVVDYLHIMRLGDRNLVEALGDAVKELRALGRELNCPVLLLSQLSRQPENQTSIDGDRKVRRRPELTDLRSSGEIEQSADVVAFLHRESYYDVSGYVPNVDEVEFIIKKNRNGRVGITTLNWYPAYMKYMDREYFSHAEEGVDGLWQAE